MQTSELEAEIVRLGPWHLEVQVTPEVSTRAFLDAPPGTYPEALGTPFFSDDRGAFRRELLNVYPQGLEGRSVLDCACNCGGYAFWAKELGAGRCFGFDVREHWLDQANFLLEHRDGPKDQVEFVTEDLRNLRSRGLEPFDVTLFKGIFYHLADPIEGLKIAAELTNELIVVDTQTSTAAPDGFLAIGRENVEHVMSGVHGLKWAPTGRRVLQWMLEWLGFEETHLVRWQKETHPGRGRLRMLASRKPGLLAEMASRVAADRAAAHSGEPPSVGGG